jgi:hypothetical protein
MRFLIIGLLLLAACQQMVTGLYVGTTKNNLAIITQEQYCSSSAFDHTRCELKWYCAVKFSVAEKGDVVTDPEAYCKTVLEEVR